VDLDGGGTGTAMGEITVKDNAGSTILETLSGVLAAASISGGVLSGSGEVRSALGSSSGGCSDHIRFDSAAADTSKAIVCGTLTLSELTITGTVTEAVVPVPAAAWLFGSALGLLGWVRRRMAS
jgi:hypothetical protein